MIYKIILTIWLLAGFGMCIAGYYGYYLIGFFGVLFIIVSVCELIGLRNNKLNPVKE